MCWRTKPYLRPKSLCVFQNKDLQLEMQHSFFQCDQHTCSLYLKRQPVGASLAVKWSFNNIVQSFFSQLLASLQCKQSSACCAAVLF